MKIVIPARRNSKGLPFKNRKLLDFTLRTIPKKYLENTFISTDDEVIKQKCKNICNIHNRSEHNSRDETSTLSLVKEIKEELHFTSEENIIMLYLTYPERSFQEVEKAYNFFIEKDLQSLLCKKQLKISPFLCMYDLGEGKGEQIIKHNLYRRQDYRKCFEISHYICIFKAGEIEKLNNNMYNHDTFFYEIEDKIDVDEKQDLERFVKNVKN